VKNAALMMGPRKRSNSEDIVEDGRKERCSVPVFNRDYRQWECWFSVGFIQMAAERI
jgi:hypothetical protein